MFGMDEDQSAMDQDEDLDHETQDDDDEAFAKLRKFYRLPEGYKPPEDEQPSIPILSVIVPVDGVEEEELEKSELKVRWISDCIESVIFS